MKLLTTVLAVSMCAAFVSTGYASHHYCKTYQTKCVGASREAGHHCQKLHKKCMEKMKKMHDAHTAKTAPEAQSAQ